MHRVICSNIVFSISGSKSPSFLMNRYKLGRFVENTLQLTPFEALFLASKKRIRAENPYFSDMLVLMKELLPEPADLILYSVYEHLKLKGFYVKREIDSLYFRRAPKDEYLGPLRVMRESSRITFNGLTDFSGSLVATVDDENDITFFRIQEADPRGNVDSGMPADIKTEILSDRHASSDSNIPYWIGNSFNGVRFLTDLEDRLLKNGNDMETEVDDAHGILFNIYSDLIRRRLIVKTGFKYGANFRAYRSSMEEHADFLVHVLADEEEWYKISRAVRVAHGVHKLMIFAGLAAEKIQYLSVERLKDPFITG